jgi:hypothetical protein
VGPATLHLNDTSKDARNSEQDNGSVSERTAKGYDSHSIDYVHEVSTEFEQELAELRKQALLVVQEKESAKDLRLEGPVRAAKDKLQSLQDRIQVLKKRIEVIKQGFPFWDKMGFEIACESCYVQIRWYCLGYPRDDGGITPGDDLEIRMPLRAQEALKASLTSCLFDKFLVCEALDWPLEVFDLGLNDYVEVVERGDYYLFGSPSWSDYDIFHISQWSVSYF